MKSRVIAIAVVVAIAVLCVPLWMNEGPLWRAVMLKRVWDTSDADRNIVLMCVWRWGKNRGVRHGPWWQLYPSGQIDHYVFENDNQKPGSVHTRWGSDGEIIYQLPAWTKGRAQEYRYSPPWWPHPPLIDLREFEE